MFIDGKAQYHKEISSPQIIYKFKSNQKLYMEPRSWTEKSYVKTKESRSKGRRTRYVGVADHTRYQELF